MKRAQDDMIRNPHHQQPARPIRASEQKHRANNRENSQEQDPNQFILETLLRLELARVLRESHSPSDQKQSADHRNRMRALVHGVSPIARPQPPSSLSPQFRLHLMP